MNEETNKRKTKPAELAVRELKPAAWNVHKKEEDETAFKGLIDSIRENGMIHRIAVRWVVVTGGEKTASVRQQDGIARQQEGGAGGQAKVAYEIIDGHRRWAAAIALGWEYVPCEIYEGMDDAEAQEMTITANVQRIENDPLLEAEVIGKLTGARGATQQGTTPLRPKTYGQIAAVLGKDERYVARRARLLNLTEKWRKWLGENGADADTMELVARHERALQDEVWDGMGMGSRGEIDADDIERAFKRRMLEINKDTAFDTEPCRNCPCNTATHGLLFETDEPGRCQKASCYREKWNAAVDAQIEKLRKKKVEAKEVKNRWDMPSSWSATKRKTKTNTVPYVYLDGDLKKLEWSEPKREPVKVAKTEEEKQEEKREKQVKKTRRAALEKVRAYCEANMEKVVHDLCYPHPRYEAAAEEMVEKLVYNSIELWRREDATEMMGRMLELADEGLELTEEEAAAIAEKDTPDGTGGEDSKRTTASGNAAGGDAPAPQENDGEEA